MADTLEVMRTKAQLLGVQVFQPVAWMTWFILLPNDPKIYHDNTEEAALQWAIRMMINPTAKEKYDEYCRDNPGNGARAR